MLELISREQCICMTCGFLDDCLPLNRDFELTVVGRNLSADRRSQNIIRPSLSDVEDDCDCTGMQPCWPKDASELSNDGSEQRRFVFTCAYSSQFRDVNVWFLGGDGNGAVCEVDYLLE